MELLYLYIHEFRNISEVNLNFSNRWNFNYDKYKNRIDLTEKSNQLETDFYGVAVKNVTALIGENGAGKTETLNFIKSYLTNNVAPAITIIGDESSLPARFFVYYHFKLKPVQVYPINSTLFKVESITQNGDSLSNLTNDPLEEMLFKNVKIAYLNYGLQIRTEPTLSNVKDLSTTGLLEHTQQYNTKQKITDSFRINELKSAVDYLESDDYKNNVFHAGDRLRSVGIHFEIFDGFNSLTNELMRIFNENTEIRKYLLTLLANNDTDIRNEWIKTKRRRLHRLFFGLAIIYDKTEKLDFNLETLNLTELEKEIKIYIEKNLPKLENDFFNYILTLPDGAITTEVKYFKFSNPQGTHFGLIQFKLDIEFASKFLHFYEKTVEGRSYLGYTWNLSSGEIAFLSYFSRIFKEKEILTRLNSIWLLIDESDLHLHPEWQREFFLKFLNFINYSFCNKRVQIIIATHSPFILSDIPKNHAIFLKRSKEGKTEIVDNAIEEETFGGNIHQLFRYSFFLDKGFLGKFAEQKINGIISDLNSRNRISEKRKNEIQKIIYSVGEPLIRNKLIQLYNDKYNLDADSRLTNVEAEVEKLKRNLDDTNKNS